MITKEINGKEYLFVEVPENSISWEMYESETHPLAVLAFIFDPTNMFKPGIPHIIYPIPEGEYSIIGRTLEITESQWKEIVHSPHPNYILHSTIICFYDYRRELPLKESRLLNATESGLSLIESIGMKPETTLILQKLI